MSTILEKVKQLDSRNKQEGRKAELSAIDFIISVAIRELNHKTKPADAEDLLAALNDSGLTLEDYAEILETIPTIAKICNEIAINRTLAAERMEYRAKLQKANRIAERIISEAQLEFRKRDSALTVVNSLESVLREKSGRCPWLFDESHKPLSVVVGAIKFPPQEKKESPKNICDFCGGGFDAAPDGDGRYCGYQCSRDAAAFQSEGN